MHVYWNECNAILAQLDSRKKDTSNGVQMDIAAQLAGILKTLISKINYNSEFIAKKDNWAITLLNGHSLLFWDCLCCSYVVVGLHNASDHWKRFWSLEDISATLSKNENRIVFMSNMEDCSFQIMSRIT